MTARLHSRKDFTDTGKKADTTLIFPQDMEKEFYPEAIKFSIYERHGVEYDEVKELVKDAFNSGINFLKAESDVVLFSGVSGDNNPVHISEEFAKNTLFKRRVAHGFFTASLISTVIGTKLPGPGSIYLKQSLKFIAPVYIGETINVKVKVKSIDLSKKKVILETFCEKNKNRR